MKIKHPPRRNDILNFLQANNSQRFTSQEIVKATKKYTYGTLIRDLQQLTTMGCIYRYNTSGPGYLYAYNSHEPTSLAGPKNKKQEVVYEEISAKGIENLARNWSAHKWRPKIFDSYKNLPYGIARLLELSLQASYGAVISQGEIDEVRVGMKSFHNDLTKCLSVVNGFLLREELWQTKTLGLFLLGNINQEGIDEVANKLKENN